MDVLINQANVLFNMNENDSAWHVDPPKRRNIVRADRGRNPVILKNVAYYEMLKDFARSRTPRYRAAMLAEDLSAVGNALSLLCQIYIKQNRYEKAQMLMSIMPRRG